MNECTRHSSSHSGDLHLHLVYTFVYKNRSLSIFKHTAVTKLLQPNTIYVSVCVCSYAADSPRGTELEGIGERIGE